MKFEFSRQIFEKYSDIKFHENPSSGSRVVPCDGQQIKMTKLTAAFRNFAKAPKNGKVLKHTILTFPHSCNISNYMHKQTSFIQNTLVYYPQLRLKTVTYFWG
jgi:hypothetical protein